MARALRRRAQLGSLTASRREGIRCLAVLGSLLILPGLTTAQPTDDLVVLAHEEWRPTLDTGEWEMVVSGVGSTRPSG